MKAHIINGTKTAQTIYANIKQKIESNGIKPGLASVVVGNDLASHSYVSLKQKRALECGFTFIKRAFPSTFEPKMIIDEISALNANPSINGILIQLPLPVVFERRTILKQVHPYKDVDGLHPKNLGLLMEGHPVFLTPVTLAVLEAIHSLEKYPTTTIESHTGSHIVPDLNGVPIAIIGDGLLVGRPVSVLLSILGATVTVINETTQSKSSYTKNADVIITGTNSTDVLQPDEVRDGCIILDVGSDIVKDKFLDTDVSISTNPGGIGPLTVAFLLQNTLHSALRQPTTNV